MRENYFLASNARQVGNGWIGFFAVQKPEGIYVILERWDNELNIVSSTRIGLGLTRQQAENVIESQFGENVQLPDVG